MATMTRSRSSSGRHRTRQRTCIQGNHSTTNTSYSGRSRRCRQTSGSRYCCAVQCAPLSCLAITSQSRGRLPLCDRILTQGTLARRSGRTTCGSVRRWRLQQRTLSASRDLFVTTAALLLRQMTMI